MGDKQDEEIRKLEMGMGKELDKKIEGLDGDIEEIDVKLSKWARRQEK